MFQYLFFDLDGTLTPSRQRIHSHMANLLPTLPAQIIIVSGSKNEQIREQVGSLACFRLGQNGNHALAPDGSLLWEEMLSDSEKQEIHHHIAEIKSSLTHYIPDESDLIEDRGSQISFSIYGHHAPPEEKKACDGDFAIRRALLTTHPFTSQSVEVQIGGTTCFDYFMRGHNKGKNVARLIEHFGWPKEHCVYFGDALFPGGNDASVEGVVTTIPVADEEDTYKRLVTLFNVRTQTENSA